MSTSSTPTDGAPMISDAPSREHAQPDVPRIAPPDGDAARPAVSVVTACFNALEPLRETVDSIRGQTFRSIEHVVVDGGSADGSRAYLESLGDSVRWTSEPDDGIADAMNKGVALARGEWIVVLHAGDSFDDGHSLDRTLAADLDGVDILVSGIRHGGRAADRIVIHRDPRRRLMFKALLHQGTLCRRDVFERIGGFDRTFRIGMDYEFFLRARNAGMTIRATDTVLSRMDDSGVSSRVDWPSLALRFAEERRAQMAHCPGPLMKAVYSVYWPLYLAYRRIRAAVAARRHG